jgi:uncharacterized membrane protein
MSDTIVTDTTVVALRVPDSGLIAWTHTIYALHSLAILIGVTSAVTVVGAFIFGLPSIIAVVLTYIKRGDAQGTFLESHYSWLLKTFWYAAMGAVVAGLIVLLLFVTVVGWLLLWLPFLILTIWLIYRIAVGWLALKDLKPLAAA